MVDEQPEETPAEADAADVRADTGRRRYLWVVLTFTIVAAQASGIYVSRRNLDASEQKLRDAQHQSEQAWCGVITVIDDGYRNPVPGAPPLTPRGRKIAEGIAEIRLKYRCPPSG